MGHIHLKTLAKTRRWQEVVALIQGDGGLEQIAAASATAAEYGLTRASKDQTLVHVFWLLTQLPQVARAGDFANQLTGLGLDVQGSPTLLDIVGAFARAVDQQSRESGTRTDLGEMAQLAATETLASLVSRDLPNLFGSTSSDVQKAIAKLGTPAGFSVLARDFFSRLTHRCLAYFLSTEMSNHVGPGKRFAAIADHRDFQEALDLHCREASRIIKEFSGGWYGKTLFEQGRISPDKAGDFAYVAFKKLRTELRRRRGADV